MTAFNIENYINSLPDDIEFINICNRGITYLPSLNRFYRLKKLNCSYNNLTSLPELNDSLQVLDCSRNELTSLPKLNNNLIHLDCCLNNLTVLPKLNNNLAILLCSYNLLITLPKLNKKLKLFTATNCLFPNGLEHRAAILNETKINKINNIIEILHNFKVLFWALKFKRQFRDWLWIRVRQAKIEKIYHPNKLNELLHEKDDITEEELDNVISKW